ncbi:GyrI-like domain-containing protein [Fodinicola feengrottensis]|nr:GyrI-like domain-containing protein [Fodinicola feengrottensis]
MNPTQPSIIHCADQPYVAIGGTVTMRTIGEIADRIPAVFGWLASRGIAPAGPPFLRYTVIDMSSHLEIEAGVPVATEVPGDEDVRPGVLPAGRYVTVTHLGSPEQLVSVVRAVLEWGGERGLRWDREDTPAGEKWGCRLESYKTNPVIEPDMSKWETELAFRLAD